MKCDRILKGNPFFVGGWIQVMCSTVSPFWGLSGMGETGVRQGGSKGETGGGSEDRAIRNPSMV